MSTPRMDTFDPLDRLPEPQQGEPRREALRNWIVTAGKRIRREELRDDTPLLEHRLITSLQVMDLILFIEALTGKPLNIEQLKPGLFRDINTISRHFLDA